MRENSEIRTEISDEPELSRIACENKSRLSESEENKMDAEQNADGSSEAIYEIAKRIMKKYKNAFLELAK